MSFFSGLDYEGYDRQYTDRQLVRRIVRYFHPHLRKMVIISVLLVVIALSGAAMPILVGRGIDLLGTGLTTGQIVALVGAVLGTGVLTWATNWLRRRLSAEAIGDVVLTLRSDAFTAATAHDLSFYDQYASGRIVSRITSDTQDFAQVVVIVTDLVTQIVQTVFLAVILIQAEWRLSLIIFRVDAGDIFSGHEFSADGPPGDQPGDARDGEC